MHSIVIVEDQEIIRTTLVNTVDWASVGCNVIAQVSSGEEGVEMIESNTPDIVITDIHLPGIDGITMLEKAAHMCSFQSIIITGFSQFKYAKKAISLSVVDYILKPIDEDKLLDAVRKAAERIDKSRELEKLRRKVEPSFSIDILENKTNDMHLKQIFEVIRRDYGKQISFESICNEIGMNTDYISRKLRALASDSFPNILSRHRIEVSKQIMKENATIKFYEVAEKVGFSSYKRFSLVFKRISGQTPSEYMKSFDSASGGK